MRIITGDFWNQAGGHVIPCGMELESPQRAALSTVWMEEAAARYLPFPLVYVEYLEKPEKFFTHLLFISYTEQGQVHYLFPYPVFGPGEMQSSIGKIERFAYLADRYSMATFRLINQLNIPALWKDTNLEKEEVIPLLQRYLTDDRFVLVS